MPELARQENPFNSLTPAPATNRSLREQSSAQSEVQTAMVVAQSCPRDPMLAMDRILNACTRPSLAEMAVYEYARGGTQITGPSIRLAEAIAQNWGNLSFGIREIDQHNGVSTVQAFAWDLETNNRREVTFQVKHQRSTKKGSYQLEDSRDIYELVANQGSRRLRSCLLAVIPGDVVESAVKQCELTLKASCDTGADAVKKMLAAFDLVGVTKEMIEKRIQRRMDTIQPAQVIMLRKIYTSMNEGMSSRGDWFELAEVTDQQQQEGTTKMSDKIKADIAAKKSVTTLKPVPTEQVKINCPDREGVAMLADFCREECPKHDGCPSYMDATPQS